MKLKPIAVSAHAGDSVVPSMNAMFHQWNDIYPFVKSTSQILDEIETFITREALKADADRALATILYTDMVASTERAATLGDRRWRNVMETHLAVSQTIIDQHRGRLVRTTGDGVLATFDGPGRAIRCALALKGVIRTLGIEIRAGLHTGEVEVMGDDVGGIAVHLAARVMSAAGPGEVLVSSAVPPLVAGSGIEFDDRGERELKGVPGSWKLFAVD